MAEEFHEVLLASPTVPARRCIANRYYDPATAQFTTVDPLDAITQSPYAYGSDNPDNADDPLGLWPSFFTPDRLGVPPSKILSATVASGCSGLGVDASQVATTDGTNIVPPIPGSAGGGGAGKAGQIIIGIIMGVGSIYNVLHEHVDGSRTRTRPPAVEAPAREPKEETEPESGDVDPQDNYQVGLPGCALIQSLCIAHVHLPAPQFPGPIPVPVPLPLPSYP